MKIAILTSVSEESSRDLARALRKSLGAVVDVHLPFKSERRNFKEYDWVFSYGCSASTQHQPGRKLNKSGPTKTCVDKFATFAAFANAGVPHPRNWKRKEGIPRDVQSLVIRQDPKGRKAEDISYWDRWERKPIPDGALYSEWFNHQRELRVTYILGKVFVYRKDLVGDQHIFNPTRGVVYSNIMKSAKAAAEEIGIDFVSFDVLYNGKDDYCFLEANSGSLLQDEVTQTLIEFFKEKM